MTGPNYTPQMESAARKLVEWSRTENAVTALDALIHGQAWGEHELFGAALLAQIDAAEES
jgi:hypothetical protein